MSASNSDASTAHGAHSPLGALVHHAMVAAVLALVIVVFDHHGWLNWLDSVALRVALVLKSGPPPSPTSTPSPVSEGQVRVLLLGPDAFESAFKQESPLARPVLAEVLNRMAARTPKVIAIDIDLSPGPEGSRGNAGQGQLDATLLRIAAGRQTRPVLVTPFPVADEKLLVAKQRWMDRLCRAGVRFAYPHIHLSQGLALRFSTQVLSLGVVTASVAKNEFTVAADDPCQLVSQGPDKAVFLSTLVDPAVQQRSADFGSMLPLDPDALQRAVSGSIVWAGNPDDAFAAMRPGEVVFIGASYDPRDAFLTLSGPQPGVMFHAASAETLRAPPHKVGHVAAFGFDIVLGVSAGYLFAWGWTGYNQAASRQSAGLGRPWQLYLRARGWLLANVLILAAWLFLLFALSALLLRAQLWASPAAMVLGVFAKTLLASRHGAFVSAAPVSSRGDLAPVAAPNPHAAARLARIADFAFGAPLLLYGAYLAFLAH